MTIRFLSYDAETNGNTLLFEEHGEDVPVPAKGDLFHHGEKTYFIINRIWDHPNNRVDLIAMEQVG